MACFTFHWDWIMFALLSSMARGDLVGDICRKATDPKLCNHYMRSDPQSRGANLLTLAKIATEKSKTLIHICAKVVQKYEVGSTKLKSFECIGNFNYSIGYLNDILSMLRGPLDPYTRHDITFSMSKAGDSVSLCDDDFRRGEPPPTHPDPVPHDVEQADADASNFINDMLLLIFMKL